ncbi:MAG: hypothetical protein RIG63_21105 [Coleofasciculus chthonoplastes F3-SA18-01]|uniref:hypothetical protein n=1 Tax=Coleofasciculus chthonoplastes TaxID=64178 RepID=UPI0032FC3B51
MIQKIWAKYYKMILGVAIALMSAAALPRLVYELTRLLWLSNPSGAIDLKLRYQEVHLWFSGEPVYSQLNSAVYPPASYVMLLPFLGYPSLTVAKWIWALTSIIALIWLANLLIHQTQTKNTIERVLVVMTPLAMYATGITIGNGQLTIHILVSLVAGLTLMCQKKTGWGKDLLASLLIIVALVKPTLAVPFFWIVLFVPGRVRPTLMVPLGYVVLAWLAAAFQESDIFSLHHDWLAYGIKAAAWSSAGGGAGGSDGGLGGDIGYGDLHSLMGTLGLSEWNFPVSILVLLALGCWVYWHRCVDLWLLVGVVAIVARVWTYHRVYDDMLILLSMVTLFRIAKQDANSNTDRVVSGMLFAIALIASLVPASLRLLPSPWDLFFKAGQTTIWMVMLIFLLAQARREKQAQVS